jgi:poly(3-hydroxybutyrate) depolymerase
VVRRFLLLIAVAAVVFAAAARLAQATTVVAVPSSAATPDLIYRFSYRTHDGDLSYALLLLPAWYGPARHPAIPLVICPHGRNTTPETAAKRWYNLPTEDGFAVVLPAGQGRVLKLYSWGYPGQIADLARMPALAEQAVPFFHYQAHHVYAVGASMGAQEVLLLLAKHPQLLAGAIAFDPALNLANRYYQFPKLRGGSKLQAYARLEVGGAPGQDPAAYRLRSPSSYIHQIANSDVPLELWWSTKDQVILDQASQAGRFYQQLLRANSAAPISSHIGEWRHTAEDSAFAVLPSALRQISVTTPSPPTHQIAAPGPPTAPAAPDGRSA